MSFDILFSTIIWIKMLSFINLLGLFKLLSEVQALGEVRTIITYVFYFFTYSGIACVIAMKNNKYV